VLTITDEQREELCAWVAALGADPSRTLPEFRIFTAEGGYKLHLSMKVRRDGRDQIDLATGRIWTEPLVLDLGPDECWPAWLLGMHVGPERSAEMS
jgi:hypothetical protein